MAKIKRSKRYEIRPSWNDWTTDQRIALKKANGWPSGQLCLYDTKLGVPLAFGSERRLINLWRELSS